MPSPSPSKKALLWAFMKEAVPEGTIVPVNNVLVQVCNTDPQCFWLTNYIETSLLRAVWYPTTVATLSLHIKAMIKKF